MAEKKFVADLKVKQDVTTTFLVKYLAVMEAKDGRNYLNIVLADCTGDLEARAWTNAHEISEKVSKGNFVIVSGKVNLYQGRKQFIINEISTIDESEIEVNDYIFSANEKPEVMFDKLVKIVEGLNDVYIKQLLINVLSDEEIKRRLLVWQAGKSIHHAYKSGLLEHILSCTELAVQLSPRYKVNESYVVAGAILHDLCKIYELSDGHSVEYTEEGKLVGHLTKGTEIVDRFSYKIKNFPYYIKLHLKHILLSHHGEYEYGSPKVPQTSEAMLVHLIDLMDSKMNSFETIKRTDTNPGDWSGFVKHLDRIVYKNELPTFTEFKDDSSPKKSNDQNPKKTAKKPRQEKEIKQNLGKLLEGFKVDG